jgi:hypothetical protein
MTDTTKVQVRIMRLPHAADLPLPAYQSVHAAGLDLVAAIPVGMPVYIAPGGRAAIPTGLAFALPAGIEGQIRPRSGLALHYGVTVLNSPGTLDADYRGEAPGSRDRGHALAASNGLPTPDILMAPTKHRRHYSMPQRWEQPASCPP